MAAVMDENLWVGMEDEEAVVWEVWVLKDCEPHKLPSPVWTCYSKPLLIFAAS